MPPTRVCDADASRLCSGKQFAKLCARAAERDALTQARTRVGHQPATLPNCVVDVRLRTLAQYAPHIVPSKYVRCAAAGELWLAVTTLTPRNSDRLFCRITGRLIHTNEAAVLRQSEGKRFQLQLSACTPHFAPFVSLLCSHGARQNSCVQAWGSSTRRHPLTRATPRRELLHPMTQVQRLPSGRRRRTCSRPSRKRRTRMA